MNDSMDMGREANGAIEKSLPLSVQKKRRLNAAQRVVNQARARSDQQGNVKALPSTRLERKVVDGRRRLAAIFPRKGGGEPECEDLSFLLDFPGLCEIFAKGFLSWGGSVSHGTRETQLYLLKGYWIRYLKEGNLTKLKPQQVDEQILGGFTKWLQEQKSRSGKPLHPNTIRKALSPLRCILAATPEGRLLKEIVPAGPRGANHKTAPTEVLNLESLMKVMAVVEDEVLALRKRKEKGRQLLEQGRQLLHDGVVLESNPRCRKEAQSEQNLALVLAMLDQRYPGVIPDTSVIRADDPLLGRTLTYAISHHTATSYFYASTRDLVPLVLGIALATAFNPDTVLGLEWKNIDRNVDRLSNGRPSVKFDVMESDDGEGKRSQDKQDGSTPLTKMTGGKDRAWRPLVRLLDPVASGPDQVSLNLILDLLVEMTARIRPHVFDKDHADRVFIFVQLVMTKRPKAFSTNSGKHSGDIAWQNALARFIRENDLPRFTLQTIRATLIDFVQIFNRGDLEASRQVGNHRSGVITWTHYTSNLVRKLLQEATGETMLVRERWLLTDGTLDPRKFQEWTDKGCATPGFACLDPFDSPRHNQKKGRLCTAYGECPECPLSAARPNISRNVMLYEALRRAIYRSVTSVTATVWRERWAPVVVALDRLLSLVQPDVLADSRKLAVELPNVG